MEFLIKRKRFICIVILLAMLCLCSAAAESFLPSLNQEDELIIPSFTDVVGRYPIIVEEAEQATTLVYDNVKESDYYSYGEILDKSGCSIMNYSFEDSVMEVQIEFSGKSFSFQYDTKNLRMTITIPNGLRDEPHTTPTPEPSSVPDSSSVTTPIPESEYVNVKPSIDFECKEYNLLITEADPSLASNEIGVTLIPDISCFEDLIWESSNPSVVEVDENGIIHAVSAGKAQITVKAKSLISQKQIKATCVVRSSIGVSEIRGLLNRQIGLGKITKLTAKVLPDNAANKKVRWSSDDENIATVDNNGNVRGINPGKVKVTCEALDGSGAKKVIVLTVLRQIESIKPKQNPVVISSGDYDLSDFFDIKPEDADNRVLAITDFYGENAGYGQDSSLPPGVYGLDNFGKEDIKMTVEVLTTDDTKLKSSIDLVIEPYDKEYAGTFISEQYKVKYLIMSCPAIATVEKETKDFYDSISDYKRDFPKLNNSANTWRITIQDGIVAFYDDIYTSIVAMIPQGEPKALIPGLKWEIKLLEAIPLIKRNAERFGMELIVEKRVDGGDYGKYADENGVINLLDETKYEGVLAQAHTNLELLEMLSAFSVLEDVDSNGNGGIDFEELFK